MSRFQLKQSWPQAILPVLATLGVVADLAGVFDASAILKICIAVILILMALLVRFRGHRWTFMSSLGATAIGIAVAAVIILAFGVYQFIVPDRSAQQSANREVCAAAENYNEAYVAAATQWAATGLRSSDTERADSVSAQSLDRLSQCAIRSGGEDFKTLVHDLRMRANLALAQGKSDAGDAATNLQGSWTSLTTLFSLCKKMGYPVAEYSRLPIEPSVARACELIDQMVTTTSSSDASKWTTEQQKQFTALLNMFIYHGLSSSDDRFSAKALDFVKTINKNYEPSFDRLGPIYGSCVARGYDMRLADSVPREYLIP